MFMLYVFTVCYDVNLVPRPRPRNKATMVYLVLG